jgi:hypothetical protein
LLVHLFLGGFTPPAPYMECGTDPTEDVEPFELGCEDSSVCGN